MNISVTFNDLPVYLLVFVRMAGLIFLNPMLSRRNLPAQIRVALAAALTLLLVPNVNPGTIMGMDDLDMIFAIFKELLIGMACACVFQIFYYLLFFAGDLMDMQFGMSMAKVFDPGTNIQMSITGNMLSILFMLYILVTDSHLLMIQIFATTYDIVPIGVPSIDPNVIGFLLNMFVAAFNLILRLTLPFLAAEFVLEVSMGVLMKLIPQIHVFVINIQFKMMMGLFLLLIFGQSISIFIDKYLANMFQTMERVLFAVVGQA